MKFNEAIWLLAAFALLAWTQHGKGLLVGSEEYQRGVDLMNMRFGK